jgi:hypothetical protein
MSGREQSGENYYNNESNDYYDPTVLELRGSKIVYYTNGTDILEPILFDLATHKVDDSDDINDNNDNVNNNNNDDNNDAGNYDSVVVQFDADIESEKAIGVLTKIVAHIETHGLPPTSIVLPRSVAKFLVKMEQKKPVQVREIVRRLLIKAS